ncbi:MAG: type II toxin-antitoxin system PemK/MazF family toxin [Mollicutes bacterium UO1]
MKNKDFPQEGEVWIIKFDKLKEFSKPYRPCLVVSNNAQNEFDENIVVVGLTTDDIENIELFEVFIKNTPETGLDEPSKICCNYLHTVNKKLRLVDKKRLGVISPEIMEKAKATLKIVLNLKG